MTVSSTTQLDATATALKNGAAKLAELLKQHAALKSELETAATEADAGGLPDFAEVIRDMARRLGPLSDNDGKPTVSVSKRRGRPPKPAHEEPSNK